MNAVVDAFAGIGWAIGLHSLGIDEVGVEHNADVCALRAGLGLRTIRADVAAMPVDHLRGKVDGAIFSPPCQSFSAAGKRKGLNDPRGLLVREPLRWVEAMRPRWVACEQVPDVAPYWRAVAARLRSLGYSTWTGILDVADYGVPQNRTRAFLMASIDVDVAPPEPTHSRTGHAEMFGAGRQRWMSMAEALGWDWDGRIVETQNGSAAPSGNYFNPFTRPSRTICGARTPRFLYTGNNSEKGGDRREPYARSIDRPAPVVDTKAGWSNWKLRYPGRSYDAEPANRPIDEPSPAVALGHNVTSWAWERPATCVQGTPRIAPPGYRGGKAAMAKGERERAFDMDSGAIPVELWELGVLQGFPPDFPWHLAGTKTAQATIIGNAVPPPVAAAVVGALTGAERTVAA